MNNVNNISHNTNTKILSIHKNTTDPLQFRLFIGIPSPEHRWITLKLLYYRKLLKGNPITILHEWMQIPDPNAIPLPTDHETHNIFKCYTFFFKATTKEMKQI